MAGQRTEMCLFLAVVAVIWVRASAQTSDCTNTLVSMSPCLNYITGNSSNPSSGCCSQLASVVRSKPQCLCQVLSSGGSMLGININQTQATALPGACKIQTPPVSRCNGGPSADSPSGMAESPNAVPSGGSSADSPFETPASPNTVPSETGSKTVPSTDSSSSDASSTKMKIVTLFFLLVATSTSTIF